jgi:hypothetical protein
VRPEVLQVLRLLEPAVAMATNRLGDMLAGILADIAYRLLLA